MATVYTDLIPRDVANEANFRSLRPKRRRNPFVLPRSTAEGPIAAAFGSSEFRGSRGGGDNAAKPAATRYWG